MQLRPFRRSDAPALAELSAHGTRGEGDFVLNPLWETEDELFAEFERFGISPEEHLLVAEAGDDEILGLAGFLRRPGAREAGLCAPVVKRGSRGKGIGGELLRGVRELGRTKLGIHLATAGVGTRNRAGYSLLTSLGFRPVRQHFLMRCDAVAIAAPPRLDGLELEVARKEDAEAILALYTACGFEQRSPDSMHQLLRDPRFAHSVAREGSRVVAFAEIETHWPRRVWVSYVGVDPERRDRGLGSTLVGWSLARQFAAGAQSALLLLSPANRSALRAYEKGGFRRYRLVDVLEQGF